MPGLLQSPDGTVWGKFCVALMAEFVGVLLFALYGDASPVAYAPWGNGLTLAVLVYITANVSGGHLNPAVTTATVLTGHMDYRKGLMYIIAQIGGACCGSLLLTGLSNGYSVGMGDAGPGCFTPQPGYDLSQAQLYGWELIMTFVLVSTVYAVAVGEPSFGNVGPLAIGFALWASSYIGGQYTGTALNPARVLGTTFVFHCYWNHAWVYVLGELSGGILAGLLAWPLYGSGAAWEGSLVSRLQRSDLGSAISKRMMSRLPHTNKLMHDPDPEVGMTVTVSSAPSSPGLAPNSTVVPITVNHGHTTAATVPFVVTATPLAEAQAAAEQSQRHHHHHRLQAVTLSQQEGFIGPAQGQNMGLSLGGDGVLTNRPPAAAAHV